MNQSELRIGNLAIEHTITPSGKKEKVIAVAMRDIIYTEGLSPLPITEDALMQCGLDEYQPHGNTDGYKYWHIGNFTTHFFLQSAVINGMFGVRLVFRNDQTGLAFAPNLRFLTSMHQLQNLIFDLTGKEMFVKIIS